MYWPGIIRSGQRQFGVALAAHFSLDSRTGLCDWAIDLSSARRLEMVYWLLPSMVASICIGVAIGNGDKDMHPMLRRMLFSVSMGYMLGVLTYRLMWGG